MKRHFGFFAFAALLAGAALMFGLSACSSGGDDGSALLALAAASGGTSQTGTSSDSGTQSGGGTSAPTTTTTTTTPTTTETPGGQNPTPAPTPTVTYVITFNSNDGSENPATATQSFTEGTPQALKTIAELGFSKNGFSFAGWGTTADATESAYADGNSYTATANVTLYALWSSIPVFSVNIPVNPNGSLTATPATAVAGTEVIITISPAAGYRFENLNFRDSNGIPLQIKVSWTGNRRTFTMPAKNITMDATFKAIVYSVNVETSVNGSVVASPTTATIGDSVTLTTSPEFGYELETVTVTANDGTAVPISVEGKTKKFTMPANNVTVTATFAEIPAASGSYTEIGTTSINGIEYNLVTFGLWPQTIKSYGVSVKESETKTVGAFVYCKGSDGQWYVKIKEDACYSDLKYSDGATAGTDKKSEKWFKVEPIKWRVITANYNGTGKKLLLAENALAECKYYDSIVNRSVNSKTVYSNNYEHSTVRAFLNGLSYVYYTKNANNYFHDTYLEKGFLQTAFEADELSLIADTSVDNSARSANPDQNADQNATEWNSGNNQYASDQTTTDKVFLLSVREATKSEYGFDSYNAYSYKCDSSRCRKITDYAIASGLYYYNTARTTSWFLRSPYWGDFEKVCKIYDDGAAKHVSSVNDSIGVVPALCVSN